MPRANTTKLIHSIDTGEQLSRYQKALRKKIEESILLQAANDDTEIDQDELKKRVFIEEASGKIYALTKSETDLIMEFVWDRGLTGGSKNKRLMEELYEQCQLGPGAITRRDKISTKVHNVYRTYRETKEMFSDEDQDVADLAERLSRLLNCFKDREGAQEALASFGILMQAEEDD